jgi:hypothetical protein
MAKRTKTKKLTVKKAAEQLTAVAEKHLANLPEEEQEARVAAFARVNFKSGHETSAKSSSIEHTRGSRVVARARE